MYSPDLMWSPGFSGDQSVMNLSHQNESETFMQEEFAAF